VHIVLIGDSIFDNSSYVYEGESVSELLSIAKPEAKISLLAVDGDVTTDVSKQLLKFPKDATTVFISCGGNDALRSIDILEKKVSSVGEALDILYSTRESFRSNYVAMLENVLRLNSRVSACTIYNNVPGISERALTALAIFNEVILEELSIRNIPVVDLRIICNESSDYSEISPIEPSRKGGEKIVQSLLANV
jgi:hypothetical protein